MVLLPRRAAQSRPLVSSAQAGRQQQREGITLQIPGAPPSPGEPHGLRSVSRVGGHAAR